MPDKKEVPARPKAPAKESPMPAYGYQRPTSGSLTIIYDDKRPRVKADPTKVPALHNLKVALG